eukprot:scaffold84727_cov72-Phaeocystis_antarctica.AAC.3
MASWWSWWQHLRDSTKRATFWNGEVSSQHTRGGARLPRGFKRINRDGHVCQFCTQFSVLAIQETGETRLSRLSASPPSLRGASLGVTLAPTLWTLRH